VDVKYVLMVIICGLFINLIKLIRGEFGFRGWNWEVNTLAEQSEDLQTWLLEVLK